MTLPLLTARLNTLRIWARQCEPDTGPGSDVHEAQDNLLRDFTLAVANGALKNSEAQLAASMICEAFGIRSSTH
jgi:hypothetical protein